MQLRVERISGRSLTCGEKVAFALGVACEVGLRFEHTELLTAVGPLIREICPLGTSDSLSLSRISPWVQSTSLGLALVSVGRVGTGS